MAPADTLLVLIAPIAVILLIFIFCLLRSHIDGARSPLNVLAGPKSTSIIFGNITGSEMSRPLENWVAQYGDTMTIQGLLGSRKLVTVDPVALRHVLSGANGRTFVRPAGTQRIFGKTLGKGLLFAEGDQHRRQRKIINPAFGLAQVRLFTNVFVERANQLRDIWLDLALKSTRRDGRVKVDAFSWLNKATLDIIGSTGFDYNFGTLGTPDENSDKLYKSFQTLTSQPASRFDLVQMAVPQLSFLSRFFESKEEIEALEYVKSAGRAIVEERKNSILSAADGRTVGKDEFQKDLLSLLIKSNIASDLSDGMRMSDDEIAGQITTFMFAGHETTSTAVSWTLFALACHPAAQAKLRSELRNFSSDTPTMDELDKLPQLDYVVREVLRLYAPVSMLAREVAEDTVIPLGKPVVDKTGTPRSEIYIRKGEAIIVPIRNANRSVDIWGEDAQEFRPERWEKLPETANALPSVYSNMLTFNAGPHACIGFRFSVIEMKAIVFAIIRAFEVEFAMQPDDIVRKTAIVGRPGVDGITRGAVQLPILIRPSASTT